MRTKQISAYVETSDLALCAALLAIGIDFVDEEIKFVRTKGTHGERLSFFMNERSTCNQYSTLEMINAWHNENFHINNPDHPFAYIKCAFKNREGLLDKVNKHSNLVIMNTNGKLVAISETASESCQDKIFSQV